jgi:hypothetical protein
MFNILDFLSVKYSHISKYLFIYLFFKYGFKCEGEKNFFFLKFCSLGSCDSKSYLEYN